MAAPRVHSGPFVEIDVATDDVEEAGVTSGQGSGGVATAVWSPAQPTLAVETESPDADEYEVRVYDTRRGRRLVAAVELVSPANKDRPEHRRVFVAKCAALLQQGVAVSIVDVVTVRDFNLFADPPNLYAVSCRWRPKEQKRLLEAWNQPLALGQPLPTLPLWLTDTFAVPLELEESYAQTCRDLRLA